MNDRAKNIATLTQAINDTFDLLKKRCPQITEDNYDKIKAWMQPIVAELMNKPEKEVDKYLEQLIAESYGIALQMEAVYMVRTMKEGAHG